MNRILVVDDEPSVLQGIALGLASKQNTVDCTSTGKAAIKKGSEDHYDVVIVDLSLPDLNGFDVIRKLRERNPQIIAIVITAQHSMESVVEGQRLGVDDYLEKPFAIRSVKEAIERGIAQRAHEKLLIES